MRVDTFPADGEFAGSDPDLMFRQLIMEAGADIAILEPLAAGARLPEAAQASAIATNLWIDKHWLDSKNNCTSAGAARSRSPSRIRWAPPARSRRGPATPTWRRF